MLEKVMSRHKEEMHLIL